jgi:hypothetical protein
MSKDDRNSFGARVDYQLSDRQTVLGRFMLTTTESVSPPVTRPIGNTSRRR